MGNNPLFFGVIQHIFHSHSLDHGHPHGHGRAHGRGRGQGRGHGHTSLGKILKVLLYMLHVYQ